MRPRNLLFTIAIALTVMVSVTFATDRLYDATCRVSSSSGSGTGCAIHATDTHVFVLTANHVVGQNVKCTFWHAGHESIEMPALLYDSGNGEPGDPGDAALLVVSRHSFGDYIPTIIPLAPRGVIPQSGDTIYSAGCAMGAWQTGFKGHYVKPFSGSQFLFLPNPAVGRSGAAVLDSSGQYVIGIVLAQGVEDQYGLATTADTIRSMLRKIASTREQLSVTQCQGGTCPSPSPYYGSRARPPRGVDIEAGLGQGINIHAGAYPTLPVQTQAAPQVYQQSPQTVYDVSGLAQQVADLNARVTTIEQATSGAIASAQQLSGVVDDKLQSVDATVDGKLQAATDGIIEKTKTGVLSYLWTLLSGYGWWAGGAAVAGGWLAWKFLLHPFADRLDGVKDGHVSVVGLYEQLKYRVDMLDGKMDWTYKHIPVPEQVEPPTAPPATTDK